MNIYEEMTQELDQSKLTMLLSEELIFPHEITSSYSHGIQDVFDIEIDSKDGLFTISDLAVHNCKESLLARGFMEASFHPISGEIRVTFIDDDGKKYEQVVPSKARVKFWDSENYIIIYGAIEIAIANSYPIAKDSLRKLLTDRYLWRLLED